VRGIRDLVQRDEVVTLSQIGRHVSIGDFVGAARSSGKPAHDLVVARSALDEEQRHVKARGKRARFGAMGGRGKGGVDDHAGAVAQARRGLVEQRGIGLPRELVAVGAGCISV